MLNTLEQIIMQLVIYLRSFTLDLFVMLAWKLITGQFKNYFQCKTRAIRRESLAD
jgi:hypothetical protein